MAAFRGSASTDTGRFADKTRKMMNKIKFPPEIETKIDMSKIELATFRVWISTKIEALLGTEDDILVGLIENLLDKDRCRYPDAKYIYVTLVPFLNRHVRKFMVELWNLLKSAQESSTGVPQEMIDKVKKETMKIKRRSDRVGEKLRERYGEEKDNFDRNEHRKQRQEPRRQEKMARHTSSRDEYSRGRNRYEDNYSHRQRDRGRDRVDRNDRDRDDRRRKRRASPSPPSVKKKRRVKQCQSPSPPRKYLKKRKDEKEEDSSDSDSSSDSESSNES